MIRIRRAGPLLATMAVLLLAFTAGCLAFPNFASLSVMTALLGDNAFVGIAAIGATFVIISGGIDLSAGAVIAATSVLVAVLVGPCGWHPLAAFAVALAAGTAFGAGMGALIHWFRLPPFLVTLAGMFAARALGFMLRDQSLGIDHPFFSMVSEAALPLGAQATLPLAGLWWVGATVIAAFAAHASTFGRDVYALGGDEESAWLMGLPVARTKVTVYALGGFCSALAGIVFGIYTQAGNPASCVGLELDIIAGAVIGGTLLTGGVGQPAGSFLGVLILGVIQTLINFHGALNSWWTRIVVGALLLGFILIQKVLGRAER